MVIYLGTVNEKMDREMAHESAQSRQEKVVVGRPDENVPQDTGCNFIQKKVNFGPYKNVNSCWGWNQFSLIR